MHNVEKWPNKLWYYHILKKYRCLKNAIHQIGNKNEWLLLSTSFTAKFFTVDFCLHCETLFLRGFVLKPTERA